MEARSAMHILNAPSTKSLKYAIQSGVIKNCPIIPVQNLKTDPVFEALDKIFRCYNKAGFQGKIIKYDWAFIPLTDDRLDNVGVTIDPTAAGNQESTAEGNNRMLKERVKVALARLPYTVVPKVINVNINYKSDMVAEFGTDSSNLMEPGSIKAIYIEPTKGQRNGHQVLNLNTKKMISRPKVCFDKKRDLETFQDGDQIAGVDDTEQGYIEEAFDQDYDPEDFDDINDSKREELLADADNDVNDMSELTVRFQGGGEEEEPIVADLDHHQENINRGTDDIGSLITDLEDLQEPPEEEIVFEPEMPQVAKVIQSGQAYAQAAMSGLNLSQVPKKPREWPSSRSGSSANKNKNRVVTRSKH
ncbi:unnamed protein product [Cylindrotheca closterium]|uniref:Uncharacterized protein n=1 Tax=Cylindrotheca closterium TaxID=2856 RepID=A0AAD2CVF8_9STRA|nr:unnamed protein product [Cylindrotheca closterium]